MPTLDPQVLTMPDGIRITNPLDVADWDAKLSHFPEATFFHSLAWARVLHSTYGYRPLYLTAQAEDKITAVLPLMEIDSWLTGKRGVALPFTDACGVLDSSTGAFGRLFQSALTYARKRRWKYLEYRGGRSLLNNAPASMSYFNHRLQLQSDETALFAGFESSVRRAIRKAQQNKLTVEFSQSPSAIQDFYAMFCKTRQRHGVPPQPFSFFANIQRHVLAQKQGWVVLARQGNEPVAGAVFFHYGKSVIYKFGASDETFQNLRANNLVMWEAIRHYAKEGFTTLDFGRTSLHNDGLRRFKLGWGTQEGQIDYVKYDLGKNKFAEPEDDKPHRLHDLYKFVPVFFSRAIGLLLYKHIAALALLFDWNQLTDCA